jgi:hypothetical protein
MLLGLTPCATRALMRREEEIFRSEAAICTHMSDYMSYRGHQYDLRLSRAPTKPLTTDPFHGKALHQLVTLIVIRQG